MACLCHRSPGASGFRGKAGRYGSLGLGHGASFKGYIETPGDIQLEEVDFDETQFRKKGFFARLSGGTYRLLNLCPDQFLVLGKCETNPEADIQLVSHYSSMLEAFRNDQVEFESDYLG